jgi:hypothetical protein
MVSMRTSSTLPRVCPPRFRRGLLTEAALALEAEVRAQPGNAEAWRLLGTVHAENDDDQQAIAAMGECRRPVHVEQGEAMVYCHQGQQPVQAQMPRAGLQSSCVQQSASAMLAGRCPVTRFVNVFMTRDAPPRDLATTHTCTLLFLYTRARTHTHSHPHTPKHTPLPRQAEPWGLTPQTWACCCPWA